MSLSVFPPDSIQLPIHADDTPHQAPVYLLPLPSFPDILLFLCALHIFPMSSMKDAITGNTYYCPCHPLTACSPPFLFLCNMFFSSFLCSFSHTAVRRFLPIQFLCYLSCTVY